MATQLRLVRPSGGQRLRHPSTSRQPRQLDDQSIPDAQYMLELSNGYGLIDEYGHQYPRPATRVLVKVWRRKRGKQHILRLNLYVVNDFIAGTLLWTRVELWVHTHFRAYGIERLARAKNGRAGREQATVVALLAKTSFQADFPEAVESLRSWYRTLKSIPLINPSA